MEEREKAILDRMLKSEGYFVNDPNDKGGFTYRGIARNYHPKWEGWKIIDSYIKKHGQLKRNERIPDANLDELIYKFYSQNFYSSNKIGEIKNIMTAIHIFDHGVNAGLRSAAIILQRSIAKISNDSITIDGVIGPKTIAAANDEKYMDAIGKECAEQRKIAYTNMTKSNSNLSRYLKSWINRVNDTTEWALDYAKNHEQNLDKIEDHCNMK